MVRFLSCLFLIFAALVVPALSQTTVTLGDTSLRLLTPPGFCQLVDSDVTDRRLLSLMREQIRPNQLLAVFADCAQLTNLRTGRIPHLDDVFYYAASETMTKPGARATEKSLGEFCDFVRAEGDKLFPSAISEPTARLEKALEGVKVNESRLLGVMKQEAGACYWGMLQGLQAQAGSSKTNLTISAIMLLKDKQVTGIAVSRFVDKRTSDQMLSKHTAIVAKNRSAN
jgi:hypothetical protein